MRKPEDSASEFDDFESSFGAEFDADLVEDLDEPENERVYVQAAWQRLDERTDEKWLREQLSDWDDWYEFGDDSGLH